MSTLKVNTIQNTSGVEVYTAKAWVNFNGTGTVAIRASGNVTSITDNGVGDYTLNFTNALADVNYGAVGSPSDTSGGYGFRTVTFSTTSLRVQTTTTALVDSASICVAIFR